MDQARKLYRLVERDRPRSLCLQDLSIIFKGTEGEGSGHLLARMLSSCKGLEGLHLELASRLGRSGELFGDTLFRAMRDKLPCVKHFSLRLTTEGPGYDTSAMLLSILVAWPCLTILHIRNDPNPVTPPFDSWALALPLTDAPFAHHLTSLGFDFSPPLDLLHPVLSHSTSSLRHLELGVLRSPKSGDGSCCRLGLLRALKPIALGGRLLYFGVNDTKRSYGTSPNSEPGGTWPDSLLPLLKSVRTLQLGPAGYTTGVFGSLALLHSLEQVSIVCSPGVWSMKDLARFLATSIRGGGRLKDVTVCGDPWNGSSLGEETSQVLKVFAGSGGIRFTYSRKGYMFGLV